MTVFPNNAVNSDAFSLPAVATNAPVTANVGRNIQNDPNPFFNWPVSLTESHERARKNP